MFVYLWTGIVYTPSNCSPVSLTNIHDILQSLQNRLPCDHVCH